MYGRNVKHSVRLFADSVTSKDVQGFVEHCDKFCTAVVNRDPAVLEELTIHLLGPPAAGLG